MPYFNIPEYEDNAGESLEDEEYDEQNLVVVEEVLCHTCESVICI